MNRVTIRTETKEYNLQLDFNRVINDVLEKLEIGLDTNGIITTNLYKHIVNPNLSFTDNGITNNEILEIKGNNEN